MKKSIKNLEVKEITNIQSVKGGSNGKGTKKSTTHLGQSSASLDLL